MATQTGTFDLATLLATRYSSAASFGLDNIAQILAADLAAHNAIVTDMISELCEVGTDRHRIYGTGTSGEMVKVDEYGRAPTQKALPGSTVGFPLEKWQFALGWTADYMQKATPADLAIRQQGAEQAHLRAIQKAIKLALYDDTNYTFVDYMSDNVSLTVKRLVNADSAGIPNGPNGETFDGATHQHYVAATPLAASDVTTLIANVLEHGHGSQIRLAIAQADEAAFRLLSGFTPYVDQRTVAPQYRLDTALDTTRTNNRAIGVFGAAEVWVKPWAQTSYIFCWDAGATEKPVYFRQESVGALQGLRIAAQLETHPLYAQYMEAYFGVGVWARTNGAILYTGAGAWADATIT